MRNLMSILILMLMAPVFGIMGFISQAHAQVNPGDILVLDRHALLPGRGLFSVNQASGSRRVLSDWNNAAQDPAFPEDAVRSGILEDVAVSASGDIVILDFRTNESGTSKRDLLFRINPTNGNRTIISDFRDSAQGIIASPDSVAFDGEEILVAGEFIIGGNLHDALFHVDPKSGFRTLIVDFQGFEGILTEDSLAVDASGNVFILDVADFFQGGKFITSKLYKVDPTIAKPPFAGRILLSDFGDTTKGETGRPSGMAVDASGNLWVIASQGALPVRLVLFKIDPKTGTRVLVAGDIGISCAPSPFFGNLAVDSSGNILLAAEKVEGQDPGILFCFNPTTGVCTKVTDFANRAQGELGVRLGSAAVSPTAPMQPVDLAIANMEITQGIQNFANDVPLVQDKTTYVRVYPKVDTADRRVGARLRGFRAGAELPGSPLRPLYPLTTVHTGGAKRETLNDSFNFWIPPAWCSGLVSFQAEINSGGAIPETDTSNNIFSLTKEFIPKAPVCVVMIPVRTHGSRYTVNSPGFESIIRRFESLWPVPDVWVYSQSEPVEELQACWCIPPVEFGPYELPDDGWRIIASLFVRGLFTDDPDKCDDSNARTHYVGMVSQDTTTGSQTGYGSYVSAQAYVVMETNPDVPFYTPPAGATMAQELSHNYNTDYATLSVRWLHVDCGDPEDINFLYPYPTNQIGPVGPHTFWGFDPITKSIIAPDGARDYMSYCTPKWASDYTWRGMLDEINNRGSASIQSQRATNEQAHLSQSAEILVIVGAITPIENVASFEYVYRLLQGIISAHKLEKFQSGSHLLNVAAVYVIELVDTNGAVLFSQPFNTTGSFEDDPAEVFSLTVPFHPNTARIRITHNGQTIGALTVSRHAPQVRLLQPSGGETITDRLTIQWEASDEDNDPLLYTVQYSLI